jgi:hypothetical protein
MVRGVNFGIKKRDGSSLLTSSSSNPSARMHNADLFGVTGEDIFKGTENPDYSHHQVFNRMVEGRRKTAISWIQEQHARMVCFEVISPAQGAVSAKMAIRASTFLAPAILYTGQS